MYGNIKAVITTSFVCFGAASIVSMVLAIAGTMMGTLGQMNTFGKVLLYAPPSGLVVVMLILGALRVLHRIVDPRFMRRDPKRIRADALRLLTLHHNARYDDGRLCIVKDNAHNLRIVWDGKAVHDSSLATIDRSNYGDEWFFALSKTLEALQSKQKRTDQARNKTEQIKHEALFRDLD